MTVGRVSQSAFGQAPAVVLECIVVLSTAYLSLLLIGGLRAAWKLHQNKKRFRAELSKLDLAIYGPVQSFPRAQGKRADRKVNE